jgi:hypothetical protein
VVIGYAFEIKGSSRIVIDTNESDPVYSLAGQLMGMPLKGGLAVVERGFGERTVPVRRCSSASQKCWLVAKAVPMPPYCGQRGRPIAMPDQTLGEERQAVWQMSRGGIDVIYFGS